MLTETLGFIGGGNMARSLIGGLIARGLSAQQVHVSEPIDAARETLSAQLKVHTSSDNAAVARAAQVLILAVKPQVLRTVALDLAPAIAVHRPLVISIAAGIRAIDLQRWLGDVPIVRCMPNGPALIGCGVTGLYAMPNVTPNNRALAAQILDAVGQTLWVEKEQDLDAVTAVSGSGPAYFYLLIEMLEASGVELGLNRDVARKLAVQTAYGAGSIIHMTSESAATLREQVTSKGGTTEAALKHLESANARGIFSAAIAAAAKRSAEMAEQLGKD